MYIYLSSHRLTLLKEIGSLGKCCNDPTAFVEDKNEYCAAREKKMFAEESFRTIFPIIY